MILGPPCRPAGLAATPPPGAISESSPSSGCSAAKTTRKGAPFQGVSGAALYAVQRLQLLLPVNPQQMAGVSPDLALNTAISFTTNTS